jgi:FAD/FMN-containing dehydrogenase
MKEATLTTGTVDDVSVEKLKIDFGGEVLRPSDTGYDEARTVYNGMFDDRKPAAMLRCQNTNDVVAAVNFARESGLLVAVRGGGHSIAGFSVVDGGLVIDLSAMKSVQVDAAARIAKVEPGVKWAELDAATQEHGLATPGGFVSTTGVAGLTLNGGIGFLSRKYGLTSDNLLRAEVVTASGEVIVADESQNADLLWGLRGGGGNFGIVTRFEYRLHPLTDVFFDFALYPADKGAEVLRAYRALAEGQPDEVFSAAAFATVLPNPMFPEELYGQKTVAIFGGYLGSQSDAEPHMGFVHEVPDHLMSMAMPIPYVMAQQIQDEATPWGSQNYWKSGLMNELTDEAIDKIATIAPTAPSPRCTVTVFGLGGEIARVDEESSAYPNRDAAFDFSIDNIWEDPAENEMQIKWSRDFFDQLKPHLGGAYLNFIGDEGQERVRESYGPKYSQLASLKRKYDPTNLFRLNQNIRPS